MLMFIKTLISYSGAHDTLNRGRKTLQDKEKMRKESGPGPISNLEKFNPGMARSARTQTARRRQRESMFPGRATSLVGTVCVMSPLPR